MKIIDAHIHLYKDTYFDKIAVDAGHENTEEHLKEAFEENDVVHGVVMGNRDLIYSDDEYPDYLSYCVGINNDYLKSDDRERSGELVEQHFRRKNCVGVKLYPGYNSFYVNDPVYHPIYRLAEKYGKPVAIHTGATAGSFAYLKYSHPLTVDEAATAFPRVHFVMCHFGSPWLVDAAAVMDKNHNVSADLSGILEGLVDMPLFLAQKKGFVDQMTTWIDYVADYSRFMYGTDWPLANIQNYIDFTKAIIPEEHHQAVFFDNANRIYQLGL